MMTPEQRRKGDILELRKREAEKVMNEARNVVSRAQKAYAAARKAHDKAQLAWLEYDIEINGPLKW